MICPLHSDESLLVHNALIQAAGLAFRCFMKDNRIKGTGFLFQQIGVLIFEGAVCKTEGGSICLIPFVSTGECLLRGSRCKL